MTPVMSAAVDFIVRWMRNPVLSRASRVMTPANTPARVWRLFVCVNVCLCAFVSLPLPSLSVSPSRYTFLCPCYTHTHTLTHSLSNKQPASIHCLLVCALAFQAPVHACATRAGQGSRTWMEPALTLMRSV